MRHRLLQVAIGGRQNPHVDGDSLGASYRTNLFFLNGAQQLGLKIHGEFSDFIQKHGAAFGDRKQAIA